MYKIWSKSQILAVFRLAGATVYMDQAEMWHILTGWCLQRRARPANSTRCRHGS